MFFKSVLLRQVEIAVNGLLLEKTLCSNEKLHVLGNNAVSQYSLEEWRDLGRAFYDVRIKTEPQQFSAEADFQLASRLIITKVRFTPLVLSRDPKKINEFDCNYLLFERYAKGEGRGVVGDIATEINEGKLHLIDMSQCYTTSTTDVVGNGVLIPHDFVGYDPSRDPHYVSLPRSKPQARLLETALDALDTVHADGDLQEIEDLSYGFAGLIQRFLLGRKEDTVLQNTEATLNLAMRDHIETHLADPDLNTANLCRHFGLSRASLYRRFREDGGVEHYISGRRLDRCLLELCAAAPARGLVKSVASRWGYIDASNFHRRFRQRFDIAPNDCLAMGAVPSNAKAVGGKQHLIHHWMRQHRL